MWQKKFGFLIFITSIFCLFFFASPTYSAELCAGTIPAAGQKFVKIKVTNSDTPSGGQDACISVPENAKTLGFQDLLRVPAPGIVSQNWGENEITVDLIRCDFEPRVFDATPQFKNRWFTVNSDIKLKDIQIKFDPLADCALQNGGTFFSRVETRADHPSARGTLEPNFEKFKRRWKIEFANEVKYIHLLGVQLRTEENNETLNICRQQLFQQLPQCNDAQSNPGLAVFIAANNLQTAMNALRAGTDCEAVFRQCVADVTQGTDVTKDPFKDDPRYQTPANYQGPLPDCSFSYDGCRNVNDILVFFIKIGQTMFQVIGTFAFVMFIYGGFTIILSMGNSERVKKGQEVLVAAVVGILIAFSAYLIIDFVLDALQVGDDFRSIGQDTNTEQVE